MRSSRAHRQVLGAVLAALLLAASGTVFAGPVSAVPAPSPRLGPAITTSPITQIAAGNAHTCALHRDTTVTCWGENGAGQLGDGTTTNSKIPVAVTGLTGATTIGVGPYHSCAVLGDGTVRCWGYNPFGQLGNGTSTNSEIPVRVSGITNATTIAAGWNHTCAGLADGTVRCWGQNLFGELGDGTATNSALPVAVSGITSATTVAATDVASCARIADGSVRCWGHNGGGELGDGTYASSTVPVAVAGITGATTIAAGGYNTCALLSDGTASCWGSYGYGRQVGLEPGATETGLPIKVGGLTDVTSIAVGVFSSCAGLKDGSARCWGDNDHGQLGNGTTTGYEVYVLVPVSVTGITSATDVAVGELHSCALLSDGTARCWGYNDYGQLGDGSTADSSVPVTVFIPRSSAESFVTSAYQDYIGRLPSDTELNAGLGTVGDASSIQKRSQFTTALAQSDTYLGAVVNKLYVDTLGRTGDSGGVAYWTNQLRTGQTTVAQAAGLFYASPEYFAGYGNNNLTTWVNDLYHKILLRSPDSGGLAYYVDLAQRTNRYTVAYPFYQSLESSNTRVKALYQHFLGRAADQGGLDYWATRIPTLGDVALASNLTLSTEYLTRAATRYP